MTDRKALIKSYRRQGLNQAQIAVKLGVSRQRVNQILNPQKHDARVRAMAVLDKKPCEYPKCTTLKAEAHHPDYNSPLDVIWLCIKHHKQLHKALRGNDVPKEKKPFTAKCLTCQKGLEYKRTKPKFCTECMTARVLKKHRKAYNTDPGRKAAQKLANKNWRENNPEKWNAIQRKAVRAYQKRNPEKVRECAKTYYYKNLEESREYQRQRYHITMADPIKKEKMLARKRANYWKKKELEKLST